MTSSSENGDGNGNKVVVVGVKMDGQSRELLTWSLVKLAHPGDLVIALHVLSSNEIVDEEGNSSLLSLVKAFDSVLAVYEGFCNLKQVDLKLKICRGSSVRKVLVREANSYGASKVIVGAAAKRRTIGSSISMAKYCAKNLPKDCSVLAIRNGKVVFQREALASATGRGNGFKDSSDYLENGILEAFQRSISIDTKLDEVSRGDLECSNTAIKQNCTICSPDSGVPGSLNACTGSKYQPNGNDHDPETNSMALVLLDKLDTTSSSHSLIKESPEIRPGWPLLRHLRNDSIASSSLDVPVEQWERDSPGCPYPSASELSSTAPKCEEFDDSYSDPGDLSDAIVPVGTVALSNQNAIDQSPRDSCRELERLHEKYSSTCRLFKFEELQSATSECMPESLIGKGGNSQVYRGSLPDGKELAVKILKQSEDVLKEFVMEIEIITGLSHKNIISLFGFCYEDNNLLLVYDLLPRGSLEENLHGSKKDPVAFGWNERFKVAVGLAEALYYLHNNTVHPVIHRDVKSSNILLSEDFEPQLSDFGLATTSSHITCTDVAGTFGYLAPEYFMFGKVTEKIDVYAYGVVLLELLSGRKPISSEHPKGQESLVMWAKPILNGGKVSKLLDPCMGSNYDRDQIERMVLAATLCIRRAPRARPQMSLILKLLQGEADILRWARSQVNASDNDRIDQDGLSRPDLQSHLSLALLDVEDDSLSVSSIEQHISLEEYLRGRWSRSSSFA